MLIKLTLSDNREYVVNPLHIVCAEADEKIQGSHIKLTTIEQSIFVRETLEDIVIKVNKL